MSFSHRGGGLLVDKPVGPSSHEVVQRVRRLLGAREVGHCGTLDPLASGLLVLVVGQATRLAAYSSDASKAYRCTALLGVRSETDDAEGAQQVRSDTSSVNDAALRRALDGLRGEQDQVPPAYSAVHVNGERAHARARRGETVELPSRRVCVEQLELLARHGDVLELEMVVSKGTYVRALVRDLGELLGCGAMVQDLRRTRAGHLDVAAAATLAELERADPWACLLPPAELVEPARRLPVDAGVARALWRSSRARWEVAYPGSAAPWLAHTDDDVVGLVTQDGDQGIKLVRGFPPPA